MNRNSRLLPKNVSVGQLPNGDVVQTDQLFVFRQSGKHIVETLNPGRSVVAYLLDPFLGRTATGFASQLLFNTFHNRRLRDWEHTGDIDLAYGVARAHNRAMVEFCSVDPRLLATLYVPLADFETAFSPSDQQMHRLFRVEQVLRVRRAA